MVGVGRGVNRAPKIREGLFLHYEMRRMSLDSCLNRGLSLIEVREYLLRDEAGTLVSTSFFQDSVHCRHLPFAVVRQDFSAKDLGAN
jgi:hypothetical protein